MAKTVSPLLPALNRILKELGENIRLARLRRRLTATLVAERAGLTRVTLKKVEQGDPGVTLGAYVHVLQSLGLAGDLARLARDDELGRKLQDAGLNVPRKAQKKAILERHSMSNPQKKEIHVYAAWQSLKELTLVGKLFAETHRGKEIFSFEYDQKWLDSKYAQSLDPSLGLFPGRQYPSDEKRNFGIFLDSSPDRWGRTLLERRESQNARIDKRKSRTLLESNFLLGVF